MSEAALTKVGIFDKDCMTGSKNRCGGCLIGVPLKGSGISHLID